MEKYTTSAILEKIVLDKEISGEVKTAETKKIVITDDAFALCDVITELNMAINNLRVATLRR